MEWEGEIRSNRDEKGKKVEEETEWKSGRKGIKHKVVRWKGEKRKKKKKK